MSMYTPLNMEKWELGDMEVGKYSPVPYGPSNANPLLLNIPKLMPMIPLGKPTKVSGGLSKGCYANPDAISVGSTIVTQNYLSVPQQDNRSFRLPIFWHGDIVMVEIHNKNPDTRFTTTKVDNSSSP